MAIDYNRLAIPKGEPRQRTQGRKKRQARKVVDRVRAACVERDGYCRIWLASPAQLLGVCDGRSEWAHLEDLKRFKTRGQSPEERHTTAGSLMLCAQHHDEYDEYRIAIRPQTDRGADGPLSFVGARVQVFEVEQP